MARFTMFSLVAVLFVLANVHGAEEELKIDVVSKPEVCQVKSKNGDMLTMHYTGTLNDGTKFDSSHLPEGIERTFVMIKPDGVQRGLVGSIISRFEQKGLKLVGLKFMHASECLLRQHYAEHEGRPFFEPLVKYVQSGPVVAMVLEGPDAIKVARLLIGTTDPSKSPPGTIRGDLALQTRKNLIHGSDSSESAQREIELWFGQRELVGWEKDSDKWLHERE